MTKKLPTLADLQRHPRAQPKSTPKKNPKKNAKPMKTTLKTAGPDWVRAYVFRREKKLCRFCGDLRGRKAESRHELVFRSLGGEISPDNCVALCGDGVRGCHGFAQRHEIMVRSSLLNTHGAEGHLLVTAMTAPAAAWIGARIGEVLLSIPRYQPQLYLPR